MNIALNEALNFTIRAYDILSIYLLSFFLGGQLMFFLILSCFMLHAMVAPAAWSNYVLA
jgi:hypothetical protein